MLINAQSISDDGSMIIKYENKLCVLLNIIIKKAIGNRVKSIKKKINALLNDK